MAYQLNGKNFEGLKATFRQETNLDPNKAENIGLYIQYFQAKMSDNQMQMMGFILSELSSIKSELQNIRR